MYPSQQSYQACEIFSFACPHSKKNTKYTKKCQHGRYNHLIYDYPWEKMFDSSIFLDFKLVLGLHTNMSSLFMIIKL